MADNQRQYSEALVEAASRARTYALQLRNGTLPEFHGAQIQGGWVHICAVDVRLPNEGVFELPHGMDVRIDDISWIGARYFREATDGQ